MNKEIEIPESLRVIEKMRIGLNLTSNSVEFQDCKMLVCK